MAGILKIGVRVVAACALVLGMQTVAIAQVLNTLGEEQVLGRVQEVVCTGTELLQRHDEELKRPIHTICSYDTLGNKLNEQRLDKLGKPVYSATYSYEKGWLAGKETKSADPLLNCRAVYTRNNSGTVKEEQLVFEDAEQNAIYKYAYEGSRVVEQVERPSGLLEPTHGYTYDSLGRLIQVENYHAGKPASFFTVAYDERGNKSVLCRYDAAKRLESKTTFEYSKWDGVGNWQKKVTITNGKEVGTLYRTITYYK